MESTENETSSANAALDETWEAKYRELEIHFEKNGVGSMIKRQENTALAERTNDQRKSHKLGKLSQAKVDRLNNLGFQWKHVDNRDKFMAVYERLLAYKEKHGDCMLSHLSCPDESLVAWATRKRYAFRCGNLPHYQKLLLDDIGFVWNIDRTDGEKSRRQKQWEEVFQRLLHFKKKFGHCHVPTGYPEDKTLANWVVTQRYKQRKGTLPPHRFQRLQQIGFRWGGDCTDEWLSVFAELRAHVQKNGWDLNEQPRLGWWVNCQQFMRRKERLSEEKLEKLDKIGFPSNIDDADEGGQRDQEGSNGIQYHGHGVSALVKERFGVGTQIRRVIPNVSQAFWGLIINDSNDLYHIRYDDGNEEELEHPEVERMVIDSRKSKPRRKIGRPKQVNPSVNLDDRNEVVPSGTKRISEGSSLPKRRSRRTKKALRPLFDFDEESEHEWDDIVAEKNHLQGTSPHHTKTTCSSDVFIEDDGGVAHGCCNGEKRICRKRLRSCFESSSSAGDDNCLIRKVGTRVRKYFSGHGWFEGVVTFHKDGWTRVVYDDGDIEEYQGDELEALRVSHQCVNDEDDGEDPAFSIGTKVKKLFRGCGWYWGIVTSFDRAVYHVMFDNGSIKQFSEHELRELIFRKAPPSLQPRFGLYPVGTRVRKLFGCHGWFTGTIKSNELKYHVEYRDRDREEYFHDSREIETIVEAARSRNL